MPTRFEICIKLYTPGIKAILDFWGQDEPIVVEEVIQRMFSVCSSAAFEVDGVGRGHDVWPEDYFCFIIEKSTSVVLGVLLPV